MLNFSLSFWEGNEMLGAFWWHTRRIPLPFVVIGTLIDSFQFCLRPLIF